MVREAPGFKITLAESLDFDPPLVIEGAPALETGSSVVWFTYPGAWHDIGLFHLADGRFTGIYANILTPCIFDSRWDWQTTDLYLDLWIPAGGDPRDPIVLDLEEWDAARGRGDLTPEQATRARDEADRLLALARTGAWPPPEVFDWTLARAQSARNQGA